MSSKSISDLDSTVTAKEVATNIEMLLSLEEDTEFSDKMWSGRRAAETAELVVG